MKRLYFANDYSEGAHGRILDALIRTNEEGHSGYGTDIYCTSAKEKIQKSCHCPDADVYFLVGGTQTNRVVISSLLRPYEGVVAAATGHVSLHEAGAIESAGHKVLTLPQNEGKFSAQALASYLQAFYADASYDHMVFPGMVYLSYPTEYGTLYTKQELEEIRAICQQYKLPLYLDGARLGYGLASEECDLTLADLAQLCDVFYIGGTKVGALCGEAVVFPKNNAPKYFTTMMKSQGALLAKGRLLGIQFDTLFTDDLYLQISKHAIAMATLLKQGLQEKGYRFFLDSPTNQLFLIMENHRLEPLSQQVEFSLWEAFDDTHTVIRFATSWATQPDAVQQLLSLL